MRQNWQGDHLDFHKHVPHPITNFHAFSYVRGLEDPRQPRQPRQGSKQDLGWYKTDELNLGVFAGTYTDPGYGTVTLCAPSSTSQHCTQVLSEFGTITNFTQSASNAHASNTTLYASFPRVWCTHFRLVRCPLRDAGKGPAFVRVPTVLFPRGYGNNRLPFEIAGDEDIQEGATVRFVIEDGKVKGMGVMGLVGEITRRERTARSLEEGSDVWFKRVQDTSST
jgi:cold shock CspA family protein